MDSRQIRQLFTAFFEERGHRQIPSSSLIPPPEERTLLFTTAGMVQMKPYFMALAQPPARRLTSIQKSFRTTDIEEVGDGWHCTFFEMLGNFSVGDYFKAEVIPWAWELLTTPAPKGLGLDKSRIWTTIFEDDDEAHDLWLKIGVPRERIVRYGEKENYWFMGGPTGPGPCGPNTEINYDFGKEFGCRRPDCHPNCENPMPDIGGTCNRFIELWNLVFMTLFQAEDRTRTPLPQKNVDTGAGFERWPMPLLYEAGIDWQGKPHRWDGPTTIYDSDLFQPILQRVGELCDRSYYESEVAVQRSMRVVAEHARAATFLIADGVTPANDGRGYVLRRLIRRGTTFGQRLKQGTLVLGETGARVIDRMGDEHPQLKEQRDFVLQVLRSEETRFFETLERGGHQLEEFKKQASGRRIAGERVFYLWDTHGFPPELTRELLREDGFEVEDPETFERELEAQRQRSRSATRFEADAQRIQTYAELSLPATQFVGYELTRGTGTVQAMLVNGAVVRSIDAGQAEGARVEVVLDITPFYPEGGGQVGDTGEICWPGGCFVVEDTQAVGEGGVIAQIGRLESGTLSAGQEVEAIVDAEKRGDTMRNHTATHILHAALRHVLGPHVRQAGSLVAPDRLRFDFTHLEALKPAEIAEVERLANRVVRENIPVNIEYESYEEALAGGALAFFGDKYADRVRVVGICDVHGADCFSKELCGGTHCHTSGEVGGIVITGETSIGAGMRRIEAVSGRAAVEHARRQEELVAGLSATLKAPPAELAAKVKALQDEIDALNKRLQALERRAARDESESIAEAAVQIDGVSLLATRVSAPNADFLRDLGDGLKARLGSAVILLGAEIGGKPAFLAMATPDVAKRVSAGDLVQMASQAAGGGGGGRPELAQGGGTDASKLDEAIAAGRKLAEDKLKSSA